MSHDFTNKTEAYFHSTLSWDEHRAIFASRLKELMDEKHWNIEELSLALDVSPKTAGQWLRLQDYGEKRFPKYEHLQRIADLFEVSIAWLVGEIEAKGCYTQYVADYLGLDPAAVDQIRAITAVNDDGTHNPYEERWRELSALLICLEPEMLNPLGTLIQTAWNIKPVDNYLQAILDRNMADAKARQARFELCSNIDTMIRNRFAVPDNESFMTPQAQSRMNTQRAIKEKQEEEFDLTTLIEEYQQIKETKRKVFEQSRIRIIKSLDET